MNLYLIGYRGSGKSSVAPLLAERLGRAWFDSDREVESLTGQSIAQIFDRSGEAGFREWETSVLGGLATQRQLVVSLGGGAILASVNRELIKKSGFAVWLTAPAEVLWARISSDEATATDRPALTDRQGFDEVQSVLAEREALYRDCADYTCNTTDCSPKQVADEIADWWESVDKNE